MHVELEGPGVAIKLTCQNSEVSKTDLSVRHYLILSRRSRPSPRNDYSRRIEPIVVFSSIFHLKAPGKTTCTALPHRVAQFCSLAL